MLIADGAELAAVGGVDLHPIRNNPVANADLEKRVAFVLTVALVLECSRGWCGGPLGRQSAKN